MNNLKQISQFSNDLESFYNTYRYVGKKEIYGGTNGSIQKAIQHGKGNHSKLSKAKQG